METAGETYLTRREAAERFKISVSTLARLASQGRGPVFYKPVDVALYRPEEIEDWIKAAIVRPLDRHLAAPEPRGRGRRPAATGASLAAEPGSQPTSGKRRGRPRKSLQPSLFSALAESCDAA